MFSPFLTELVTLLPPLIPTFLAGPLTFGSSLLIYGSTLPRCRRHVLLQMPPFPPAPTFVSVPQGTQGATMARSFGSRGSCLIVMPGRLLASFTRQIFSSCMPAHDSSLSGFGGQAPPSSLLACMRPLRAVQSAMLSCLAISTSALRLPYQLVSGTLSGLLSIRCRPTSSHCCGSVTSGCLQLLVIAIAVSPIPGLPRQGARLDYGAIPYRLARPPDAPMS